LEGADFPLIEHPPTQCRNLDQPSSPSHDTTEDDEGEQIRKATEESLRTLETQGCSEEADIQRVIEASKHYTTMTEDHLLEGERRRMRGFEILGVVWLSYGECPFYVTEVLWQSRAELGLIPRSSMPSSSPQPPPSHDQQTGTCPTTQVAGTVADDDEEDQELRGE